MQCLNIILLNTLVTLYKSGTPKFTMTSGAGAGVAGNGITTFFLYFPKAEIMNSDNVGACAYSPQVCVHPRRLSLDYQGSSFQSCLSSCPLC